MLSCLSPKLRAVCVQNATFQFWWGFIGSWQAPVLSLLCAESQHC